MASEENLVVRIGRVEVDWPRTLGYFGGAAAAVAFGIVEAPFGLVIAAAPLARMLDHPRAPRPMRLVGQIFEGAVKPVGGDDEGTIKITPTSAAGDSRPRRRQPVKRTSPARPAAARRRRATTRTTA